MACLDLWILSTFDNKVYFINLASFTSSERCNGDEGGDPR
jgi:hypothetical protein